MMLIEIVFAGGPNDGKFLKIPVTMTSITYRERYDGGEDRPFAATEEPTPLGCVMRSGKYTRRAWRPDGHGSLVMVWQGWDGEARCR